MDNKPQPEPAVPEDDLQCRNARLEELIRLEQKSNDAKREFLLNISHDIRTPMNAIIGFTDIALRQNPDETVRRCLENISASSEHLLSLINDMLDISRVECGLETLAAAPVDLRAVTDSAITVARGLMSGRDLTLDVERGAKEKLLVMADSAKVRRVLVNILGNAVKFTDDGGSISLSAERLPGEDERHIRVRYRIADTGVGMSEEFIGSAFDDFTQEAAGARTQYVGSGLGLAITKRYVALMNGTVSVQSAKGAGTAFTVELPFELAQSEDMKKSAAPEFSPDICGLHILLAEDNDLNAEIAVTQLESRGLCVTRSRDGKEAVELFRDSPCGYFDLVLMDIMMPVMDGYEAARAIRALENRADAATVPIIAMTANAFTEDVRAALDAGMNAHIAKPVDMDALLRLISEHVQ